MGKKKSSPDQDSSKASGVERGIALLFAGAVLATLIFLVINPRFMDEGTLAVARFLAAAFAGISGYLYSGTLGLEAKIPWSKTYIRATGGFAAFVLVLLLFFYGLPASQDSEQAQQRQLEALTQADVIVSEFDHSGSNSVEIGRRIESSLQRSFIQADLTEIDVEYLPRTIRSETEVQQYIKSDTKAFIWGWYDDYEIRVRLYLPERQTLASIDEIPFEIGEEADTQIDFVIKESLPENVSFLALFINGWQSYNKDNFVDGYKSYNAAMGEIPQNVQFEDEGIIHFLSARQIQTSGNFPGRGALWNTSDNPNNVDNNELEREIIKTSVCEYTEAIHKNPNLAEAYNNLGVIFAEHFLQEGGIRTLAEIDGVDNCLEKLPFDLSENSAGWIAPVDRVFEEAIELRPNWSLPKYNQATQRYKQYLYGEDFSPEQIESTLREAIRKDNSLYGAYVMLANIELALEKPKLAVKNFLEAIDSVNRIDSIPEEITSRIQTNLGQAYLKTRDFNLAETTLKDALTTDPQNAEAKLALAHAYALLEESDLALNSIDELYRSSLVDMDNSSSLIYSARVLESYIYFKEGEYEESILVLRDMPDVEDNFQFYVESFTEHVVGLLQRIDVSEESPMIDLNKSSIGSGAYWDAYNYDGNESAVLTATSIYYGCVRNDENKDRDSFYGCGYETTKEYTAYVYDEFSKGLTERIFYKGGLFIIGG